MASGGEAHDAHAVGFHAPFGGALPHRADGLLRVGERVDLHFVSGLRFVGEAVFEDESRDSDGVQIARDGITLVLDGEQRMAAAGGDDHGRSGSLPARRQEDRDGRLVDVTDAVEVGAAGARDRYFRARLACGAGRSVRPEEDFGFGGGERGRGK